MRDAPAGRASIIAMNLPFIEKPNGYGRDQPNNRPIYVMVTNVELSRVPAG